MNIQRLEFLEQLEKAKSVDVLYDLVCNLRHLFDVEHAVYHTIQWVGSPFALATYAPEWAAHYEKEKLFLIDPVVQKAFCGFHPYSWKSLNWDGKGARRLLRDAIDGGVGNQGLSLPIRGPNGEIALVSVSHTSSDEKWTGFVLQNRADLMLIGYFIHEAVRRLLITPEHSTPPRLSPRERDALTLLGLGQNRATIAENLKISEHTLRVYIESSRMKLGAQNTTHAVATAISKGLVTF